MFLSWKRAQTRIRVSYNCTCRYILEHKYFNVHRALKIELSNTWLDRTKFSCELSPGSGKLENAAGYLSESNQSDWSRTHGTLGLNALTSRNSLKVHNLIVATCEQLPIFTHRSRVGIFNAFKHFYRINRSPNLATGPYISQERSDLRCSLSFCTASVPDAFDLAIAAEVKVEDDQARENGREILYCQAVLENLDRHA